MKRWLMETWPIAVLVLVAVVYCLPLFTGLDQWGRGDWDQFTLRYLTPQLAMLRDGQLPLWNPYVNGGNVLLAHPHCPAFSPWYLPFVGFSAPLAMRLHTVLLVAVGTVGMFVLLRHWRVSRAGAILGGLLLMMSGHLALHLTEGHLEWCALGLMPWLLWCLLHSSRDRRFLILGAGLLASAILDGSVYIVAVFLPAFGIWAVLESVRQGSWWIALRYAVLVATAVLLSAVVLVPRVEFVRANPRPVEQPQRISPLALASMFLDPAQAELFRATRDLRNPDDDGLTRRITLSADGSLWRRLDVTLTTTSDWTDVQFSGADYVLRVGPPEPHDLTPAELDGTRPGTDGMAIQNQPMYLVRHPEVTVMERVPESESSDAWSPHPRVRLQGTLYVRCPRWGGLTMTITRGDVGMTDLLVEHRGNTLSHTHYDGKILNDLTNRREVTIPRAMLLRGGQSVGAWHEIEVELQTTVDNCEVEVANTPYLFRVEQPDVEEQEAISCSTRLTLGPPRSADKNHVKTRALRAIVCFQHPADDEPRLKVYADRGATARLILRTPAGQSFPAIVGKPRLEANRQVIEYRLPLGEIDRRLETLSTPWRWTLNQWGMAYDWHEYGVYLTWTGLALAACGVWAIRRRRWPLLVAAGLAAAVAFGAALPIDLWRLAQSMPLYGSLQASGRFLAAVVFVAAICGGFGLDRVGRWLQRRRGGAARGVVEVAVVVIVAAELLLLGHNLFRDIFVCPPRTVEHQTEFAQRYADDAARYATMYSAHAPYVAQQSGVLRHYENIAIPRGKIRLTDDANYRGEVYCQSGRSDVLLESWSMARIRVRVEPTVADRLVLNQNYFTGWKVCRYQTDGTVQRIYAERNADGLVSVPIGPDDSEIEFYYLPDSFLLGAGISGLTVLMLLGVLLFGRRSLGGWPWRLPLWCRQVGVGIGWILLLNMPFVVSHPACFLLSDGLTRSLAINFVLFVAPGLPLVAAINARGRRLWPAWLWVVVLSAVVWITILVGLRIAGVMPTASRLWNALWLVTNLALFAKLGVPFASRIPVASSAPPRPWNEQNIRRVGVAVLLFVACYAAYYRGATVIVPAMDDHDYETQGTAYGLLTDLKPKLLTDRKTTYYFAHPPLLHFYVAASFLLHGQFDDLAIYEDAWDRADAAARGDLRQTPVTGFRRQSNGKLVAKDNLSDPQATEHRIVGIQENAYLVEPRVAGVATQVPVEQLELELLYDHYRRQPHTLATRTPNLFFAAITVALVGWYLVGWTGCDWLALLAAAVYATNPEVLVRSSYGGYFAIGQFVVLAMLVGAQWWRKEPSRTAWWGCFVAGSMASLADHKLVVLPIAVALWQVWLSQGETLPRAVLKALRHPIVLGFALGIAMFWAYGLAISPAVFWLDHVRTHLVDRITHENPLHYTGYPSTLGLWSEFCRHTGYLLLPLGLAAMAALGHRSGESVLPASAHGSGDGTGKRVSVEDARLWLMWTVLQAIAFSLIDWRQTKHLMPLLLPLCLAPPCLAVRGRWLLVMTSLLLLGLLVWNLEMDRILSVAFASFTVTPDW